MKRPRIALVTSSLLLVVLFAPPASAAFSGDVRATADCWHDNNDGWQAVMSATAEVSGDAADFGLYQAKAEAAYTLASNIVQYRPSEQDEGSWVVGEHGASAGVGSPYAFDAQEFAAVGARASAHAQSQLPAPLGPAPWNDADHAYSKCSNEDQVLVFADCVELPGEELDLVAWMTLVAACITAAQDA